MKIGRWVIKAEMTIFSDSQKRKINLRMTDDFIQTNAFRCGIIFTVDEMERPETTCFLNESFFQIFSETRRRRFRQSDVFVKMKHRHLLPVNFFQDELL